MPIVMLPPEPMGSIHYTSDYWDYWCVALSNASGVGLVLGKAVIADIAWLVTNLGIDIELASRAIEESGVEEFVNAYITTDGVLILTLRGTPPYNDAKSLAGRPCRPPPMGLYTAWARIASELAGALEEELVRHAYTAWLYYPYYLIRPCCPQGMWTSRGLKRP